MELLDTVIAGNTLWTWLGAIATAIAVYAGLWLVRSIAMRQVGAIAGRTRTAFDDIVRDILRSTRWYFLLVLSVRAGAHMLDPGTGTTTALRIGVVVVAMIQAALWGEVLITALISRRLHAAADGDVSTTTTINAFGFVSRLVLWTILLLLGLSNLGIRIGPLLAGLGVGGVAVALAVQNILGDLFASLSIVLDKPFVVGDFISVDGLSGTIERVGVKTTRVRSLSGEQLVFSNSDLLGSRIRNYRRMTERFVVFRIGVTYNTTHEQLAAIPKIIRSIIDAQDDTRFARSHFVGFGESSLDIETAYHVLVPDHGRHMDILQAIQLEIFRRFAEEGIEFAFPTRTVILEPAATAAEPRAQAGRREIEIGPG